MTTASVCDPIRRGATPDRRVAYALPARSSPARSGLQGATSKPDDLGTPRTGSQGRPRAASGRARHEDALAIAPGAPWPSWPRPVLAFAVDKRAIAVARSPARPRRLARPSGSTEPHEGEPDSHRPSRRCMNRIRSLADRRRARRWNRASGQFGQLRPECRLRPRSGKAV